MRQEPPRIGIALIRIAILTALLVFAYRNYPHYIYRPIGQVLLGIGILTLISTAWYFLQAVNHSNYQSGLRHEAANTSTSYGQSRLAKINDDPIKAMILSVGFYIGSLHGKPLFYNPHARGNGHMTAYAPARTGKTTSLVIPALLHWNLGSMVVTDTKREATEITAYHRAKNLKQRIIKIDPFGRDGEKHCINLLDILLYDIKNNNGANLHDLTLLIGLKHIPKTAHGDGVFFDNGGRGLFIALLLYLAVLLPEECHLPKLRQLVWSSDEEKRKIAKKMKACQLFGGLIRQYGNALANMLDPGYAKTYGAFRDIAMAATQIYDSHTEFGQSIMYSDFSLHDILDGKTTFYITLPETKLETHGMWSGLLITLLFEIIAASPKPVPIMFLLEEMGNLGRLPNLEKALSLLPGKGLRCWMIFQSRQQPMQIYGEKVAQLIEEQSSLIQSWSIRSLADQRDWSARIGKTTRKARSISHDPNDPISPWRLSISERSVPVLEPEEIGQLSDDYQLVQIKGQPVILAERIPYFEIDPWYRWAAPNPYLPESLPNGTKIRLKVK
ncbi:MAG: type IV secretory system conjugative DNA transfer family protein [Candidatus Thiodiazotropha endolucinida]